MRNTIFALIVMSSWSIMAQQESQFVSVHQNGYFNNPAAAGMENITNVNLYSRLQWVGYDGAPNSFVLTGTTPLSIGKAEGGKEFNPKKQSRVRTPRVDIGKTKHILGARALYDQIGPFTKSAISASYAVHLRLTKKSMIGLGIGLGWSNFGINQNRVTLFDQVDDTYTQFLGQGGNGNYADAQGGLVYYNSRFHFSFGTTQALRNEARFESQATNSLFYRNYTTQIRYTTDFDGNVQLVPSMLIRKTKNSPWVVEYGAQIQLKEQWWLGVYGRNTQALVGQIGGNLFRNMYFSYAYEYGIGKIQTASNSTHELSLGFWIGKNRNIDKELDENQMTE